MFIEKKDNFRLFGQFQWIASPPDPGLQNMSPDPSTLSRICSNVDSRAKIVWNNCCRECLDKQFWKNLLFCKAKDYFLVGIDCTFARIMRKLLVNVKLLIFCSFNYFSTLSSHLRSFYDSSCVFWSWQWVKYWLSESNPTHCLSSCDSTRN